MSDFQALVTKEREQQDARWGGPSHDDGHTSRDWIAFIAKHLGRAVTWPFDAERFKRQMVIIAALAQAAYESIARSNHRSSKGGKP